MPSLLKEKSTAFCWDSLRLIKVETCLVALFSVAQSKGDPLSILSINGACLMDSSAEYSRKDVIKLNQCQICKEKLIKCNSYLITLVT